MNVSSTILITGAAGFIGSCLAGFLNEHGYTKLILADDFSRSDKKPNYSNKKYHHLVERSDLFTWMDQHPDRIEYVFHIGARTDTTEFDYAVHQKLNVEYSQRMWEYCTKNSIPLIYASSAATYGSGGLGYKDDHELIFQLAPLNPYGVSKNEFDKWAVRQQQTPPFWAGLKFFNVYGPNEYHKGRMASVIWHSFNQIREHGFVKLFRSHRKDFRDGEQLRDFIYVQDVLEVCYWLMNNQPSPGLYNLGTGTARTFNDLVAATFAGLRLEKQVRYIDMPADIRDKYQYFTEADMTKIKEAGYNAPFVSLEKGISEYVQQYLIPFKYF
jgi:ADP-L-glycero-D-manno-heptose 6-epimerase